MSSTSDPIKQEAREPAIDEPGAKRAKISDKNEPDANNATAPKNEKAAANGNNDSKLDVAVEDNKLYDDGEGGAIDGPFDPRVAKSLEQVEDIQKEITNLNEQASEEILKVEQKFNKLRRPYFEKRSELLKGVPDFWLTTLENHPEIGLLIQSAEEAGCLHYMVNLDVEENEDIKSGYKLKFHFVDNPYIKNEVIVREFKIVSSEEVESSSTPIEYRDTPEGQSLKYIVEDSIAQYRRNSSQGNQIPMHDFFFGWLVGPTASNTDEIAEIIKDQIWPSPQDFFFASRHEEYANTDDESDEDEETDYENIDGEEGGVITEGMADFSDEDLENEDIGDDDDDEEDEEEDEE